MRGSAGVEGVVTVARGKNRVQQLFEGAIECLRRVSFSDNHFGLSEDCINGALSGGRLSPSAG